MNDLQLAVSEQGMTAQISWQKVRSILVQAGLPMAQIGKGRIRGDYVIKNGFEFRKFGCEVRVSFASRDFMDDIAEMDQARSVLTIAGFEVIGTSPLFVKIRREQQACGGKQK